MSRLQLRFPFVLAVSLLTIAIPLRGQAVRDSAGIRIVTNSAPSLPAIRHWRLSASPTLDIGTTSGPLPYQFQSIMGVTRLSNGNIVVADMGSSQLRWYDERGQFIRSAGRQGEGPGEFRQLIGLQRMRGDTLMALNGAFNHDFFTAGGEYAGRPVPETPPIQGTVYFRHIRGWFDDGTAVVVTTAGSQGEPPRNVIRIDSMTAYLWQRPSTHRAAIGPLPYLARGTSGSQVMHVTFGPSAAWATNGRFYFWGFGDKWEIRAYDSRGTLTQIVRRAWTPHVVTAPELDAWKTAYTNPNNAEPGGLPLDALYQLRTRNLTNMIVSKTLPAFTSILADSEGNVWVRDSRVTDFYVGNALSKAARSASTYSVIDPSGRWLCNVTVPQGVHVMEVGRDYVAGIRRDRDDVEHVVVYRIEKP